jgi:hypothetical protein
VTSVAQPGFPLGGQDDQLDVGPRRGEVGTLGISTSGLDAALGQGLEAVYEWSFRLGPGFVVGVGNGLILGWLMYRSELVPRGLVLGKRPSAVLTLVERTSRAVLLVALPAGWRAEQVRPALTAAMRRLPSRLRRSLTWDQGKEMAEHARFTADTGVPVYFCDPRSPWQRASNENANGLVRQYLPRTADLRRFSQGDLDRIAGELNSRPRQILGFQTPSRVFAEALR